MRLREQWILGHILDATICGRRFDGIDNKAGVVERELQSKQKTQ